MKNDFYDGSTKISIPPTLLFSVIGKIEDARKSVTMDVKRPGDLVYILGKTGNELGASEYITMKGFIGNTIPHVDAAKAYAALLELPVKVVVRALQGHVRFARACVWGFIDGMRGRMGPGAYPRL